MAFSLSEPVLRREEGGLGPLDRPRGRQRAAAPAHLLQGRGERAATGARTAGRSLFPRSARTTRSRRSTSSTSRAAARRGASPSSPLAARSPVWSPDGRSIAFQGVGLSGGGRRGGEPRRSRRSGRTRSRRSASTRPSPSAAGTSGWTTRRPICSWSPPTAARARRATCSRAPGSSAMPGFGGPGGEGSTEDLEHEWSPDSRSDRLRRAHQPQRQRLRPRERAPVRGPRRRRRAAAAHHGERVARQPRLCARRQVALLPRGAGVGKDLRAGPRRLRGVALERPDHHRHRRPSTGRSADFSFAPDGRTLYLTAEDSGFVRLFSVPARGGDASPVLESRGVYSGIQVPDGARPPFIVARWGSAVSPAEIVRIDPLARKHTPAHAVQCRQGGRPRLGPAAGVLVRERPGPPPPQLRRPPPRVRSREEVPAAGPDARRPRQHVARTRSRCAGTITCWPARATSCS